ncbi:MAG: glycosyltransferase family 2 protein [Candidatus Obscuribacter sp.]|nr:glycosyltransferase family 2 protein [Candidatus Obscuribacter sp.]
MVLAAETTKRIESIDRHYWANPSQTLVENIGKFKKSVSLLTWGYNEEELIGPFLDRAIALLDANVEDWEIIFVNDGSRDRTGEILNEYAARDKRIVPIHNEGNLNVGQSCKRAIKAANKDYLFWQTVDWSYDVKNLRVFLELLNYYDVVQGIRPTPIRLLSYIPILRSIYRVQKRSDNFQKAIVSLSNYYVLRILFGVKFQDFQNVTFYPSKLIQSVTLEGNSSFINPECLLRVYEKGARFIEVPIPFIPRTAGMAKGTKLRAIIASVKDTMVAWYCWGWRFAKRVGNSDDRQLYRVAEPFSLEEDVLSLAIPLFREYR